MLNTEQKLTALEALEGLIDEIGTVCKAIEHMRLDTEADAFALARELDTFGDELPIPAHDLYVSPNSTDQSLSHSGCPRCASS